MSTTNLRAGDAPQLQAENEVVKQRRLAREASDLVLARASAAAGRVVDSAQVKAWIERIGTYHELPVPTPAADPPACRERFVSQTMLSLTSMQSKAG
jgi:hypothetical protein